MKEIRIWDKKSSINLTPADEILKRVPHLKNSGKVLLVYEEGQEDFITEVAAIETIKANKGWGRKTDDEVIDLYLDLLNNPPEVEVEPSREEDILENISIQMEGQVDIYENLLGIISNQEIIISNQNKVLENQELILSKLEELFNSNNEPV